MRQGLMGGMLGLSLAALLTSSASEEVSAQTKNPPGWLNNYQAARAAARQSGKPMFLVFR